MGEKTPGIKTGLEDGTQMEVFLTDAERTGAIKIALRMIVVLYENGTLNQQQRQSKCRDALGEIELHKKANPKLFPPNSKKAELLNALKIQDTTLMHTAFHAAALYGILNDSERNSMAWDENVLKGKLAFLEDLSAEIDAYIDNPTFNNLMHIVASISGYCFSRSQETRSHDPELEAFTAKIYNAIIGLINVHSVEVIVKFLQQTQALVDASAAKIKGVFPPAS